MFFIKFFYFLKGYVIIETDGRSGPRLLSRCTDSGIRVYNVQTGKTMTFTVSGADFINVAKQSRKEKIKIRIVKKCGLKYVLHRYRKRTFFAAGAVFAVIFFAVSTQFLWSVEVDSDKDISEAEVKQKLEEIGVKPGALIARLPKPAEIKEYLMTSFENVPWAWAYINGVRAKVVIHEGTLPPDIADEDENCDIVARCDGFVVSVSAKKGAAAVVPGNAVNAGDVLISGYVVSGDGERGYEVHADGEVLALTHREKTAVYPLVQERPSFTGKSRSTLDINIFSREFSLFSPPDYGSSVKTEETYTLPFGSVTVTKYHEAEMTEVQLSPEFVIDFAKRDLTAQIAEELGAYSRLRSEDYVVEESSDSVTVTAKMDFIESIGTAVPR